MDTYSSSVGPGLGSGGYSVTDCCLNWNLRKLEDPCKSEWFRRMLHRGPYVRPLLPLFWPTITNSRGERGMERDSRRLNRRVRDCWLVSCAQLLGRGTRRRTSASHLRELQGFYRPTKRDQSQSLKH